MAEAADITETGFKPPYLGFQTFLGSADKLAEKGDLPPALDRSVLSWLSGINQTYYLAALRSFGLVDANHVVQPMLQRFVFDKDERPEIIAELWRTHYAEALALGEKNGTPKQLQETFRQAYGVEGADTLRKAITFFLNGAAFAKLKVSPHFQAPKARTARPGGRTSNKGGGTPEPETKPDGSEGESTEREQGESYTVNLRSGGGMLTLKVVVNLFDLDRTDRDYVLELIDKVRAYSTPKGELTSAGTAADED